MNFLFLQFLPFAVAVFIASLFGTTVFILIAVSIWGKDKELKICALGPNESGKTLFFNALRGKYETLKQKYDESGSNKIDEFSVTLENGKKIKFAKTTDLNGNHDWIKNNYEKVMNGCNRVFFFCDVCKYLSKENTERDVNARLSYIHEIMKDKGILVDNFYIILSHADECKDRKDSLIQFQNKIQGKDVYGEFSSHVAAIVNMTDSKEVKELINKMFS